MERVTRWILPLSLSINIFMGVVFVVRPYSFGFGGLPFSPGRIVAEMTAALLPADGAILRDVFAAHADMPLSAPTSKGTRFPGGYGAILAAPVFEPKALRAVFATGRQAHEAMDRVLEAALLEATTRMSTAGRLKLAELDAPGTAALPALRRAGPVGSPHRRTRRRNHPHPTLPHQGGGGVHNRGDDFSIWTLQAHPSRKELPMHTSGHGGVYAIEVQSSRKRHTPAA